MAKKRGPGRPKYTDDPPVNLATTIPKSFDRALREHSKGDGTRQIRPTGRRAATLDGYQRVFRYSRDAEIMPAHQHYQMGLEVPFEAHSISAEWERDVIDVRGACTRVARLSS